MKFFVVLIILKFSNLYAFDPYAPNCARGEAYESFYIGAANALGFESLRAENENCYELGFQFAVKNPIRASRCENDYSKAREQGLLGQALTHNNICSIIGFGLGRSLLQRGAREATLDNKCNQAYQDGYRSAKVRVRHQVRPMGRLGICFQTGFYDGSSF